MEGIHVKSASVIGIQEETLMVIFFQKMNTAILVTKMRLYIG
jgi:hypothetical protein